MRIALGQINPTVGDFDRNSQRILDFARRAAERQADIVVFPELALCGYPPRDLVEVPAFQARNQERLEQLARDARDLPALVVGYVGEGSHHHAANVAAVLHGGEIVFRQQKMLLPTYDIFDEARHFEPADWQHVAKIAGKRVALTICEDIWNDADFWDPQRYDRDPVQELATEGFDFLLNIASSPYRKGKRAFREDLLATAARDVGRPAVMVNQVGGNDQLIFDGSSFAVDAQGRTIARAKSFEEDLVMVDLETNEGDLHQPPESENEALYQALTLGVRDYLEKTGFTQAVIGLSGGIDSALVALIAVDAIGPENVIGVGMPGPYSSEGSIRDARKLAQGLGIRFELLPIKDGFQAMTGTLAPVFAGTEPGVAEENIQARLRGLTLMAIANKFNAITLTTGNKSEVAVGYCTLYGDMAGGLAVISDVPKMLVYELTRIGGNRHPGAVSDDVLTKPPSAELRPDQKDTDSLPPYEVLDPLLELYVEQRISPSEIAKRLGHPEDFVQKICRMVDLNEYKRQQAAPGLRVTSKAFGMGRRFPIAQRFRP